MPFYLTPEPDDFDSEGRPPLIDLPAQASAAWSLDRCLGRTYY